MKVFFQRFCLTVSIYFLFPLISFAQSSSNFVFKDPLSQMPIVCAVKGLIGGIYLIGTPIALLCLVWAGFLFVRARGNPEGLSTARKTLWKVLLGVGLFFGSWLIGVAIANTISLLIPGIFSGVVSC